MSQFNVSLVDFWGGEVRNVLRVTVCPEGFVRESRVVKKDHKSLQRGL